MLLALFASFGPSGCSQDSEWRGRLAVRRLIKAPESLVFYEMAHVVSYGAWILPDIEQELHLCPAAERLRLIEAIRKIGAKESLAFLQFISRWDTDPTVRKRAIYALRELH
jgi:hypothetical protein